MNAEQHPLLQIADSAFRVDNGCWTLDADGEAMLERGILDHARDPDLPEILRTLFGLLVLLTDDLKSPKAAAALACVFARVQPSLLHLGMNLDQLARDAKDVSRKALGREDDAVRKLSGRPPRRRDLGAVAQSSATSAAHSGASTKVIGTRVHHASLARVASQRTVPHAVDRIELKGLSVRVVEGLDNGRSIEAKTEISIGSADGNDLRLTDDTVSRYHLGLESTDGGIAVVDYKSTNGTMAGSVRIERGIVQPGTVLRLGRTSIVVDDGAQVDLPLHDSDRLGPLLGRSRPMRRLMAEVKRVARSEVSVLVVGETGTGKEVVARALHDASARSDGPLETVDCGAQLPALIASELFGHERGAFTGADQAHAGAFERAHGGTLFLDELGELPSGLQPMLLGALERRSFRRVGGKAPVTIDVRLVAATNRDLRAEVNAGTFRQDVYFRVAVVMLRVPPLRERPEDIPMLVEHFLRRTGYEGPVEDVISSSAITSAKSYHWPGNVRELRNFVEAAHALGAPPQLQQEVASTPSARWLDLPYSDARDQVLQDFEGRYLQHLMDDTDGNASEAARRAKMNRGYLNQLIKKHGLKRR